MSRIDGRVLVLNAGSSSLKFAMFEAHARRCRGQVEGIGTRPRLSLESESRRLERALPATTGHAAALSEILQALAQSGFSLKDISACGHRIVHGGARFTVPDVAGSRQIWRLLNALRALAPLHNGFGLAVIEALAYLVAGTAAGGMFRHCISRHRAGVGQPLRLPAELHAAGYRRYGFHGLNFEHVTRTVTAEVQAALRCRGCSYSISAMGAAPRRFATAAVSRPPWAIRRWMAW